MFAEPQGWMSACFANVASAIFTWNATDAPCRLLRISFRPGFHEWTSKSVFSSEDGPNAITILYTFELFWNTLHIWDIHRAKRLFLFIRATATLGINNRVTGTLAISTELKIMFQATNFVKRSCRAWHMVEALFWRLWINPHLTRWGCVVFDVEISADVGALSVNFYSQYHLFLMVWTSRKGMTFSDSVSIVNWIEVFRFLRWLMQSCNRSGPWGQTANVS